MTALAVSAGGCSSAGKSPAPPSPIQPPIVQSVKTEAAEGTRYSVGTDRRPLWTVRWANAALTYGENGVFFGTAFKVSGVLFKGQKEASSFAAAQADIEKGTNNLMLRGNVIVKTEEPKARLECDLATWYPDREIGEARGNVRFITDDYTMGPFDAFLFSPELKAAGTPGIFKERYGK